MAGSNTIAFSTKTMNWTTEYSFSPDRFAYVGNQLVSFPRGTSNLAWLHDKNPKYNTFYGNLYPSELQIVTNEDPSATKIYEAFSLEATVGDWSAQFNTRTGAPQTSSFSSGSLVEKEGKHYIDIPKNSLNLDPTIKYVGDTTIGDLIEAQTTSSIKLKGRVVSIPNQYILFSLPKDAATAAAVNAWQGLSDAYKGVPYFYDVTVSEDYSSIDFTLTSIDDFVPSLGDTYLNTNVLVDVLTGEELTGSGLDEIFALNPRYNASTNSIDVTPGFFSFDAMNELYQFSTEPPESTVVDDPQSELELVTNVPVSIYTTSMQVNTNGEDMRGEYMEVKISRTGADYYELYAINVDQHKTKLDHSLGQNN
jgi:hypothetical protein